MVTGTREELLARMAELQRKTNRTSAEDLELYEIQEAFSKYAEQFGQDVTPTDFDPDTPTSLGG